MPFPLESTLAKDGAHYSKASADWGMKVVVDGHLITGQNPASSTEATIQLLNHLGKGY